MRKGRVCCRRWIDYLLSYLIHLDEIDKIRYLIILSIIYLISVELDR